MGKRKGKTATKAGGGRKRRAYSSRDKEESTSKEKLVGGENAVEIENSNPEPPTSSGDGGAVAIHPLLIDHVLENIFQHLIPTGPKHAARVIRSLQGSKEVESSMLVAKNVQNLRLVCKQWKVTATSLFLRNRAPRVSFGKDCQYRDHYPTSPDVKVQNFLDVMKNSDLIPVQRYSINASFFVKANQQLMKDFMRICGPDAVEIHLYCDLDYRTMEFAPRMNFPALNLMRLETLDIDCEHDYGRYPRQSLEMVYLMEELLIAAETLQEFDFGFIGYYDGGRWVENFGKCISMRIPKTVKMLSLDMPLTDLHLNMLAERELKLDLFQFDNQCGASSKVIRRFFETQTATLKTLKVYELGRYVDSTSPALLDFPRFDELLHLEIEKGPVLPFSFPDTFPKLISLNMEQCDIKSAYVELLSSARKGLSVKEIRLTYHFPQAPFVIKAAQCFPNISRLHMSLSQDMSEALQKVFVHLDNIEELYISFVNYHDGGNEVNPDSLFSGVSEPGCWRIKHHHHNNFDRVNLRDVQHKPSILNLTKLKRLGLGHSNSLTDFTAHFLLLKMASLNEFHTNHCTIEMSPKYVSLLHEKLIWYVDQWKF